MIRCFAALLCLMSSAAQASVWHCERALSPDDTVLGMSDTQFALNLMSDEETSGRFVAISHGSWDGFRNWRWSGHWTDFDGQIAMIGQFAARGRDPFFDDAAKASLQTRGFSSVFQPDALVMTLRRGEDTAMVRCLPQPGLP